MLAALERRLEDAPSMDRSVSVDVEALMRSLNCWLVWSASARHHRALVAMAYSQQFPGDESALSLFATPRHESAPIARGSLPRAANTNAASAMIAGSPAEDRNTDSQPARGGADFGHRHSRVGDVAWCCLDWPLREEN